MNQNRKSSRSLALFAAGLAVLPVISGCGPSAPDPQTIALTQERDRLLADNQHMEQVRAENEEVQRLKRENQDLPKLRSQYQHAARLKKENEQLRQQVARLAARATAAQNPGRATAAPPPANPGDEILLEPKHLKALLPDFDWDKLERKEPLSVRSLLEKDGVQITNISQLREIGLTNYVIQRAPPTPVTNEPAQP
jgi:hypothetical protein